MFYFLLLLIDELDAVTAPVFLFSIFLEMLLLLRSFIPSGDELDDRLR